MAEALEITTFRLKGHSCADFIAANADIDAWLRQLPGFISRRIAERDDGTIIDVLIFKSVADAERSANGIMTEMVGSPVHAMIDHGTVDWSIAPVRHWLE